MLLQIRSRGSMYAKRHPATEVIADETTKAESLARCTLIPSAPATASRPWMARQARPVRERSRLRLKSSVPAAAVSRMKYQARGSSSTQAPSCGGSTTMPVEKPRFVSYSLPTWITMKCSASVDTAR